MPPLTKIKAREILDSRGNPTLEVSVPHPTPQQTLTLLSSKKFIYLVV